MKATLTNPNQVNIQDEALIVLKTVESLGEKYALNYVTQILKGQTLFGLKEATHEQLETYGAWCNWHSDRIRNLINYLTNHNFLEVTHERFGTLGLTSKGEIFLEQPGELIARRKELRTSLFDRMLWVELRNIRMELSKEEGKAPFRIFTDYTLQQLIQEKPLHIEALKGIPGFGDFKINRYGPAVLNVCRQVMQKKAEADKLRMHRRAKTPSHQAVKELFLSGNSIESIAQRRSVKEETINQILMTLYQAGEIDLRPWIEQHIDSSTLEKGTHFFQENSNARLKEAYEQLGLDYSTLKLCRLYVSQVSSYEEELKYAS